MSDLSLIRHLPIFDPFKNRAPVTIIGAGATGSRIWLSLVELGITNITIFDYDHVEAHNLANQIYLHEHIGMPKVEALKHYYKLKTGTTPPGTMKFINEKVVATEKPHNDIEGTLFLLTDTMESRKEIYAAHISNNIFLTNVIETRMASSYGEINMFNPAETNESRPWFNTLSDDEEGEVSACGSSISVGPTASVIANMAVWQFIMSITDPLGTNHKVDIHLKPTIITTK